jgi:hypothetical protein
VANDGSSSTGNLCARSSPLLIESIIGFVAVSFPAPRHVTQILLAIDTSGSPSRLGISERSIRRGDDAVGSKNSSEAPSPFMLPLDGNNARVHPVARGIEQAGCRTTPRCGLYALAWFVQPAAWLARTCGRTGHPTRTGGHPDRFFSALRRRMKKGGRPRRGERGRPPRTRVRGGDAGHPKCRG